MNKSDPYHYTECGLDNIYLVNGFDYVETPRGRAVQVKDGHGLHRAIGIMLLEEKKDLSGKEFRFFRHEIGQTQQTLAELIGVNVQSIARWEKGKTKAPIDRPAQRLLRLIYAQQINGNQEIIHALKMLSDLDELFAEDDEDVVFEDTSDGWQPTVAAA